MRLLSFVFVFFITTFIGIKAQDSGVSFELHYPIAIADDGNYATEITGILGGAVGFQLSDNYDFNYGLKYKFDQLMFNITYDGSNKVNKNNFMIHHFNGFGTYNLNPNETFKFVLEGGLTFYKYRESNYQPSYFGYNLSPGLNIEFQNKFYALVNYSLINVKLKQKQTGYIDKESMKMIRVGVGFKL